MFVNLTQQKGTYSRPTVFQHMFHDPTSVPLLSQFDTSFISIQFSLVLEICLRSGQTSWLHP